jgi:hypothetical protein
MKKSDSTESFILVSYADRFICRLIKKKENATIRGTFYYTSFLFFDISY